MRASASVQPRRAPQMRRGNLHRLGAMHVDLVMTCCHIAVTIACRPPYKNATYRKPENTPNHHIRKRFILNIQPFKHTYVQRRLRRCGVHVMTWSTLSKKKKKCRDMVPGKKNSALQKCYRKPKNTPGHHINNFY